MDANPARAHVSLARTMVREVQQEMRELREQQLASEATLEQRVTEVAAQLQEQVRSRGSIPTARWLRGVVLAWLPAVSLGRMGPTCLRGTWVCWLHPSQLRARSFSLCCSWTS